MSTLTTEGVFDGIPSRKDLKKHEELRKRVVDCKNSMFNDVDKMKELLGRDFDYLMRNIAENHFTKTFKEMFADQKPNPRYKYYPPEVKGSTYKRGEAGSHHTDLRRFLLNIDDTIKSLCLLLRYAMENRQKCIDQKSYDDTFHQRDLNILRGENEGLKAKNDELEQSIKDLYAEHAELEKAFGEEIRKNDALERSISEYMVENAELENKNDKQDHEIRRLEASNATWKKAVEKAEKSKTTGEETDWDILGLVEDSPIEDVKKQAKLMLLINHPDKSGQLKLLANREKAEARYKRIKNAEESLKEKLRKRAIKANPDITEDELSKYAVRFGTSNPFIV